MKMVEEMMPAKVSLCKNVTRYESKCHKTMKHKMVKEKRPICKLEMMTSQKTSCLSTSLELDPSCKRMIKCK